MGGGGLEVVFATLGNFSFVEPNVKTISVGLLNTVEIVD